MVDNQGQFRDMATLLEFYYAHPLSGTTPLKKPVATLTADRRPSVQLKANILYSGNTAPSQPAPVAPQTPNLPPRHPSMMGGRPSGPIASAGWPQQPGGHRPAGSPGGPPPPAAHMYETVDEVARVLQAPVATANTSSSSEVTYDDLPTVRRNDAAPSSAPPRTDDVYEDVDRQGQLSMTPMRAPTGGSSSSGPGGASYMMMASPSTTGTFTVGGSGSPGLAAAPPRPSATSKPSVSGRGKLPAPPGAGRSSSGGQPGNDDIDLDALLRELTATSVGDDY